jgi:hypothetical protein
MMSLDAQKLCVFCGKRSAAKPSLIWGLGKPVKRICRECHDALLQSMMKETADEPKSHQ